MSFDLAAGHRDTFLLSLALYFLLLRKLVFELSLLILELLDHQVFLSDYLVLLIDRLVNLFFLSFGDLMLLIHLLVCLVRLTHTNLKQRLVPFRKTIELGRWDLTSPANLRDLIA